MKHRSQTLIHSLFIGLGLVLPAVTCVAVQGKVTNTDGRTFEGEMKVQADGSLSLEVAAGGGSASYTFTEGTLSDIEFLDAEAVEDGLDAFELQQYEAAVSSQAEVHRGRSPFFKLLPLSQLAEPSLTLGNAYLVTHRFVDATGVAGVLLGSNFEDPSIHARANEILLMAFFGLERWDETEVLAKRWCAIHEPFDESALGWWILSEVHLARQEYEKARWISLQPITFSSQFPKAYLQDCFHVAIASWLEETPDHALRLYQHYQQRGYTWPANKHPDTKFKISTLLLTAGDSLEEEEEIEALTIEEGSPQKDLNLPLETVRKLTTQQEPSQSP